MSNHAYARNSKGFLKGKTSPKKSKQRRKEDKELIQQVLATVGRQEHSSDSSSNGTAESNTEYDCHFQMCDTGFQMHQTEILDKSDEDGSVSSVETYRSAQKYRSALAQQSWTLVSKKLKRRKQKKCFVILLLLDFVRCKEAALFLSWMWRNTVNM